MVDSLADGIVLQLADFSIATCNASAERIIGLTADQMLGRAPRPRRWSDDRRRMAVDSICANIRPLSLAWAASSVMHDRCHVHGTRNEVDIREHAAALPSGGKRPYAALSSIIDVTDRVRAKAPSVGLEKQPKRRTARRATSSPT